MARPTKDERLLRDNPLKSPYELLEMGLSEAAYQALLAGEDLRALKKKKKTTPQAPPPQQATPPQPAGRIAPTVSPTALQPKLSEHTPATDGNGTLAYLVNTETGRHTRMVRAFAEKRAQKQPDKYIVK